jgi:hypothetical protein
MPKMDNARGNIASWPAQDVIQNLVANTGTFANGTCRSVRALTTGTFIGLMPESGATPRTVTFVTAGELLPYCFSSRTGGTADVELIY